MGPYAKKATSLSMSSETSTTPPSRETPRRNARTREILDAAVRVFQEEGYSGFSSRRVAAVAGVRLSTLQHYFGTHTNLLLATVEAVFSSYPERYRELAKATEVPALARMEILIDDILDAAADERICNFVFQSLALGSLDASVGKILSTQYNEYEEVVAGMLQQAIPGKSEEDAHTLALLMTTQLDGMMVRTFRDGQKLVHGSPVRVALKRFWMDLVRAEMTTPPKPVNRRRAKAAREDAAAGNPAM